jgi:hypothetical protein
MNSQAKDRDALAAATRSDVNGLKRLPERQLLPQIRRSRTHIEMTGVRPTEASKAAVCYVRNTSTPVKLIGFDPRRQPLGFLAQPAMR